MNMIQNRHPAAWFLVWLCLAFANPGTGWSQVRDETPLELSGISLSESFDVQDNVALQADDPFLRRMLYRLQKTTPELRRGYLPYTEKLTWEEIDRQPTDYRFWLFERSVRVKSIQRIAIPDLIPDAEITGFYVCHAEILNPDSTIRKITVIARSIPSSLPLDTDIDEPIRFEGVLLGRLSWNPTPNLLSPSPVLTLITDRLQWYPDSAHYASDSLIALGKQGFDVGQLDFVKRQNGQRLTTNDSEAFFQMLAAVTRMPDEQLQSAQSNAVDLAEILQHSDQHFGNAAQFTAVCRTCAVTEVPYPEIRRRFGIEQYYQLVLFPDLSQKILLTENGKQVAYDRYPVTVCCTELPEGMTPEDLVHKRVNIDGFFYRIWKYESEISDQAGISGTVSPLIFAKLPTINSSSLGQFNRMVTLAVVAVALGLITLMIYLRRRGKRDPTHTEELLSHLPDRIDVSNLDTGE